MAYTFSQGYMRGEGNPNLDLQIQNGGNRIPKIYIDDLTDSFYSFDDNLTTGEKWVILFSGFTTKTTDLKVLLQGPATGSIMTSTLATSNLIPLAEPYEGLGYLRVGYRNEAVSSLSVFTANTITDWILVELRDKINPEIVRYNRAGLLKNNGIIYDLDGVTKLTFENIRDEQYYIAIKHRNHIGLMTKTAVDITSSIDFTTASTLVYGVDNRRNNSGLMRLIAGKISTKGLVKYFEYDGFYENAYKYLGNLDPGLAISGYSVFDLNLNGTVSLSGAANDNTTYLSSNGGSAGRRDIKIEQIPNSGVLSDNISNIKAGVLIGGGSLLERTSAPVEGTLRFNTDSKKLEFFNNVSWEVITSV